MLELHYPMIQFLINIWISKKYQGSYYLSISKRHYFDTIEWPFIQNVLKRFNFGQVITKWISVLYSDVERAVLNGGYSTNYFKVSRGVR